MVPAQRTPPLNPVMGNPGVFFDDQMAVVNASLRGEVRGIALPAICFALWVVLRDRIFACRR